MTDDEADQIAVIDAHFHIWPTTVEEFQGDALLDRPFHVEDYLAATAGRGVVGAIWVEAASGGADGFEETRWVFASAGQAAIIRGAVPWVPVAQADVASYVERLIISAPIPIVGTRYGFEVGPADFPASPEVTRGVRALGELGLPFDLVASPACWSALIQLVDSCEDVTFVLDHAGSPGAHTDYDEWARFIRELSARDHVVCKLSGVGDDPPSASLMERYLDALVTAFGCTRLLWGSNWPVCLRAGSWGAWLELVMEWAGRLSVSERRQLFAQTSGEVYRIGAP